MSFYVSLHSPPDFAPNFVPQWTARNGTSELYEAYRRRGISEETEGYRCRRIGKIKRRVAAGDLDGALRRNAA